MKNESTSEVHFLLSPSGCLFFSEIFRPAILELAANFAAAKTCD